jgi:hypothetical protein
MLDCNIKIDDFGGPRTDDWRSLKMDLAPLGRAVFSFSVRWLSLAQIIASAADSFLRQNMSDLGAGARTVGFAWEPESDGPQSLWYAVADARNGEGTFQRLDANLDLNSQIAYCARLFGVKLPGQ